MPPPISAVAGVDDAWVPPTMTRRRTVWPTVPPVPCPLAAMDEGAPIHGALGKVIRAMGLKEFAAKVKMAGPSQAQPCADRWASGSAGGVDMSFTRSEQAWPGHRSAKGTRRE